MNQSLTSESDASVMRGLEGMASREKVMQRALHLSPVLGGVANEFEAAKQHLKLLKTDPGNDMKLQMYGLFKQATEGKCNMPQPRMTDFVGRAKWRAWNSLGDMSQDAAKKAYVDLVSGLVAAEGGDGGSEPTPAYSTMRVTTSGGVRTLLLNRPEKKNAINEEMYHEWMRALEEAAGDPEVRVVLVTGAGDFYCSGNDLANFSTAAGSTIEEIVESAYAVLLRFVSAFIDFPKPLVAALNGPAVGISVTTLALYDAVFVAEHATLQTPFSHLGQTPEGCSTFTFPAMMGLARANALLMFNEKITAHEAYERGLATRVLPQATFRTEVEAIVNGYAQLPPETLIHAKALSRGAIREQLHSVNRAECDRLRERWISTECMNAVVQFFQRKSKL